LPGHTLEELTRFGLDFLVDVNNYILERPGQNLVVVGGGNVAMDVAITAKRLGCAKVTMVCLEGRDAMPANQEEIDRALEEGIEILNGWGPKRVLHKDGKVSGLEFKACPRVLDETGRFNPVYDESKQMTQDADMVMMAIGQKADLGFLKGEYAVESERGRIKAAPDYRTSVEWIFAAGDVTTGPATVIAAVAAGKGTAIGIDRSLGGASLPVETAAENRRPPRLLSFNERCHACVERQNPDTLPVSARDIQKEDIGGLSAERVEAETVRCFNCGCLAVNPSDMANMLYALGARIVTNRREIPCAEFFGSKTRVKELLGPGEFVTEVIVPPLARNAVARYHKYRVRKSIDFAVLSVASVYTMEGRVVKDASVVLGAVAPMPLKREKAEEFLKGKTLTAEVASAAADLALEGALPLQRNAYKIDMAKVMVRRSLEF
jgi:CO/xanthine dehydrogenase FAD-binding subunit